MSFYNFWFGKIAYSRTDAHEHHEDHVKAFVAQTNQLACRRMEARVVVGVVHELIKTGARVGAKRRTRSSKASDWSLDNREIRVVRAILSAFYCFACAMCAAASICLL